MLIPRKIMYIIDGVNKMYCYVSEVHPKNFQTIKDKFLKIGISSGLLLVIIRTYGYIVACQIRR